MEVNDELIDKLALLARLEFSGDEKDSIKKDLQNMLSMVDKMNSVNTDGVEPLLHMSKNVSVMREDEIKGSISNADALKNAQRSSGEFYTVPKVITK